MIDHPDLQADLDALIELVCAEFRLRVEAGEKPTIDEYVCRFPSLTESLRSRLDTHDPASTTNSGPGPIFRVPLTDKNPLSQFPFLTAPREPGDLSTLDNYRILKVLGHGTMGFVFSAVDPRLNRQVAIKVMRPEVAQVATAKERFLREAKTLAQLDHDHIIPIHQVNEVNDTPYIVMPLLKGVTLHDYLKKGPLPLPQILRVGREIALGLAAAHGQGLIHRDIKPANLWVDANAGDRIVILDWGLARAESDQGHLTLDNAVVGTPSFMAPEQAGGNAVDARADLYALGAVLYRLVTGRTPHQRDSLMGLLTAIATETPQLPVVLNPETPPGLSALVMKLLAKKPADRPANAQAVVTALQAIEQQKPRHRSAGRAFLRVLTFALLAGSLAAGSVWVWQELGKLGPDADAAELSKSVVEKVRRHLKQGELDEAGRLIAENKKILLDADRLSVSNELQEKRQEKTAAAAKKGADPEKTKPPVVPKNPPPSIFDTKAALVQAWDALSKNQFTECRQKTDSLDAKHLDDPFANANIQILRALIKAHESGGNPSRTRKTDKEAADELVGKIKKTDKGQLGEHFVPHFWLALKNLQTDKSILDFENTAELVFPLHDAENEARSLRLRKELVTHVLGQLVNEKECWHPGDNQQEQWARCHEMCGLIDSKERNKNHWILALHIESALESGLEVEAADARLKALDLARSWYATYVSTLARHATEQTSKAAQLLADAFTRDPTFPKSGPSPKARGNP